MFIARISKGRSVREFILGVMIIPTLLSFVWMSVFGGSALSLQASGAADIVGAVKADVSTALFAMLQYFPMTTLLSIVGIIHILSGLQPQTAQLSVWTIYLAFSIPNRFTGAVYN